MQPTAPRLYFRVGMPRIWRVLLCRYIANFVGVGGILFSIVQYPVAVVVGHFLLLSVAKYPFAQI